jgi:hypothetical protein
MLDNFSSNDSPLDRKAVCEFDLMNCVRSIRVRHGYGTIGVFTKEAIKRGVEVIQMFVCTVDPELCAKERINLPRYHELNADLTGPCTHKIANGDSDLIDVRFQ